MRGFLERIRGNEYHSFTRGDVRIEKVGRIRINSFHTKQKIIDIRCMKKGVNLRLNELVPEGWLFWEDRNTCQVEILHAKEVERRLILVPEQIPEEFLARVHTLPTDRSLYRDPEGRNMHKYLLMGGAFISLFHEIQHTFEIEEMDEEILKEEARLRRMHLNKGLNQFTEEDRQRFMELVFSSEHRAWDGAFEMLDHFRSMGLDLEPEMTEGDLNTIVEGCLRGYLM